MQPSDRTEMRKVFFECFRKYNEKLPLEPIEAQLIEIILWHPEYHELLHDLDNIHTENFNEQNPFFHMSLHLALREQVATNRPSGIKQIYQTLCQQLQDVHLAEHRMMDCLGQMIWDAQQTGVMPDEKEYLQQLSQLCSRLK